MILVRIFFCFLIAIGLVACSDSHQTKIEQAVRTHLKDPDSAKFRNIKMSSDGEIGFACISYNAKNSFGGYGGWSRAELALSNGEWRVKLWDISEDPDQCHPNFFRVVDKYRKSLEKLRKLYNKSLNNPNLPHSLNQQIQNILDGQQQLQLIEYVTIEDLEELIDIFEYFEGMVRPYSRSL